MILSAVWGSGYGAEAQYVHAYVHRLRQKLNDESAELITTVPGVGYSLNCANESKSSAQCYEVNILDAGRVAKSIDDVRRRGIWVERTINAVFVRWSGPTAIELIETPASPSATPTMPIMPGRSSLCTTSIEAAGGISTL